MDIYYGFNLNFPYQVVSAKVNNRSEGLNFRVYNNKDVEFLDVRDSVRHAYVCPFALLHSLQGCHRTVSRRKTVCRTSCIKRLLLQLADWPFHRAGRCDTHQETDAGDHRRNIPYHRVECHTTEAVRVFSERGMNDKVKLLETSGSLYTYYYTLGDTVDYYYGNLLPSTGFIWLFDIVKYYDGLLLRIPNKENPNVLEEVVEQEKMLDVFRIS